MISMWESLAIGGGGFALFIGGCFLGTARRLNRVRRTPRWRDELGG